MQVTAAEDVADQAREAKRVAEGAASDAAFKLSQAERRSAETREVALQLEARAEAFAQRLREAEARADAAERANAEQEAGARDWETRLVEADRALSLSESRVAVRFHALCLCMRCREMLLSSSFEPGVGIAWKARRSASHAHTPLCARFQSGHTFVHVQSAESITERH